MNKITICGVTGSGKTTLANKLGLIVNIPVYHLDKIAWKDNGEYNSQADIIKKVNEIIKEPKWIIDAGMPRSKTLDIRLENADTIIFYDLPLWLILWRQTKRFFKYYNKVRPDMGGNNKQRYPFTWKELKYAWNYPTQEIYSKILPYTKTKTVVIIKRLKDEVNILEKLKTLS